jgi:hypothetical protein
MMRRKEGFMRLIRSALIVSLGLVVAAPLAYAQAPSPTPPPEAAPAPAPAQVPGTQPPIANPTKIDEEEATPGEAETKWGVGAYVRFITTPKWMIELFVQHATSMTSVAFAGQVIRRKGNLDIDISVEYANVSPKDGWYEEKGDNLGTGLHEDAPDWYHFDSFALLSADVSFIWHFELTDWMQIRLGPGIGIGVPLGHIKATDGDCAVGTSLSDLDDPNTPKCMLTPGAQPVNKDIPPVVPIIDLLAGLRFKIIDQLSFNIEGGYRVPSFFVGGSLGYFF